MWSREPRAPWKAAIKVCETGQNCLADGQGELRCYGVILRGVLWTVRCTSSSLGYCENILMEVPARKLLHSKWRTWYKNKAMFNRWKIMILYITNNEQHRNLVKKHAKSTAWGSPTEPTNLNMTSSLMEQLTKAHSTSCLPSCHNKEWTELRVIVA